MVIFAVLTVFWLFLTNGTLYQSAKTLKTIVVPIVTGLPRRYQRCTNRQKQSKDSQNSKYDHWCTNRHMSILDCTNSVPTMYQSSKTVKRQSKQTWPYYNSSSFCTVCTVMSSKLYNISSDEELPVVCLQCFSVFYVSIRSPLCFLLDSEYSPKYSSLCS